MTTHSYANETYTNQVAQALCEVPWDIAKHVVVRMQVIAADADSKVVEMAARINHLTGEPDPHAGKN